MTVDSSPPVSLEMPVIRTEWVGSRSNHTQFSSSSLHVEWNFTDNSAMRYYYLALSLMLENSFPFHLRSHFSGCGKRFHAWLSQMEIRIAFLLGGVMWVELVLPPYLSQFWWTQLHPLMAILWYRVSTPTCPSSHGATNQPPA